MAKRTKRAFDPATGHKALDWAKSMLDRPVDPMPEAASMEVLAASQTERDLVLLPERAEQTELTLRPEREQWAPGAFRRDPATREHASLMSYLTPEHIPPAHLAPTDPRSTLALGDVAPGGRAIPVMGLSGLPSSRPGRGRGGGGGRGRGGSKTKARAILNMLGGHGGQDQMLMGEALPMEVTLQLFADHLQRESGMAPLAAAMAGSGRGTQLRLGTPSGGPLGQYRNWTEQPTKEQFQGMYEAFFAEDAFTPADLEALKTRHRQDPTTFAPYRAMAGAAGSMAEHFRT